MSFRKIYRNHNTCFLKGKNKYSASSRNVEKDSFHLSNPGSRQLSEITKSFENENNEISFMINLEDLIVIERSISFVLEKFNYPNLILPVCEEL